jgi:hypothetical protein
MDFRGRLLALLVVALCAIGWAPTGRFGTSDSQIDARDGIGTLPARRQHAAEPEVDRGDDDVPLPPASHTLPAAHVAGGGALASWSGEAPVIESRRSAQPRGPPSIARA